MCLSFYNTFSSKDKKAVHICGTYFCEIYHLFQQKSHKCFLKRLKPPLKSKQASLESEVNEAEDMQSAENEMQELEDQLGSSEEPWQPDQYGYIFYDIETASVDSEECDSLHVPILCVAQLCCHLCSFKPLNETCSRCGERQVKFSGESSLNKFCMWLFTPKFKGRILFAHNGGSYDHLFCLRYMHEHLIYPKVIFRGSKLIFMEVPDFQIRFLDSLNYMKCKLSKLPAFVDLTNDIGTKGYFPYKALTREFYSYQGPKLPVQYYRPGSMGSKERDEFLKWYDELGCDYVFNFKEELIKYCVQDVTILRLACLKFRQLMIETTGICPYSKSPTIAGYSHLVYRSQYMPENTIGVISTNNYSPKMNTSYKAIAFLEFESQRLEFPIRHAGTAEGEKRLLGIACDGYISEPERVYMFSGCVYHACRKCFPSNLDHPFHKGQKMGEVYEAYQKRLAPLKREFQVIEIWEHEYDQMIKDDLQFRNFVSNLDLERHKFIDARGALFGGRVEVIRTFHDCNADPNPSKLHYRDAISLYQSVLRDSRMPKGHPTLCHITTLCRTCADNVQTDICQHDDEDRAIVGTYTTEEIKACIPLGYRVITIYHVWHYTESSQYRPEKNEHGIFSKFVNTFNKMKMAASGFPAHVETDLQKRASLEAKDKIKLDVNEIKNAPGLRNIS